MRFPKSIIGRVLLAVVILVAAGGSYAGLSYLGVVRSPIACSTETKLVLKNAAGLDFQVTDSDCDTLAKEEFVSVYVSDSKRNMSWLGRLANRKVLLFRYYPENWNSPIPSIKQESPSRALISVPRVSSIIVQKAGWNGTTVIYDIGQIDYAAASSEKRNR